MDVRLVNKETHVIKETKLGFSWTALLFGFWPALFRKDYKRAALMFICETIIFTGSQRNDQLGTFFSLLIFPFFLIAGIYYNSLYIIGLLHHNYIPADDAETEKLQSKHINV